MEFFETLHPIYQALLGGVFTWLCTVFGSAAVFLTKEVNERLLAIMQGFAAGVMIAASFWSLLAPALDFAELSDSRLPAWLAVTIGFLAGGLFLRLLDVVVPHIHTSSDHGDTNPKENSLSRTTMLYLAVTIHNIPEGLSIGVAYAAAFLDLNGATIASALALTIGIGIQNIPEGSALSMPIRAEGKSQRHAFMLGQSSALVEPVAAVIGAAAVLSITALLPYALAFAAGAMIFVVVEDLIPQSQTSNHTDEATMALMVGFCVMMILDVALG